AESPQPVTVRILDSGLDPAQVQIEPGATVIWVNRSDSERSVLATDASFDSGELAKGERFQFAFTEPRSVTYTVAQTPTVQGTVIVGDAPAAAPAPTPFAPGSGTGATGATGTPGQTSEFAFTGSATSVNALIGGLVVVFGVGLIILARRL